MHITETTYGVTPPIISQNRSPGNWGEKKVGDEWCVFWAVNSPLAESCQQLINASDWVLSAQYYAAVNVRQVTLGARQAIIQFSNVVPEFIPHGRKHIFKVILWAITTCQSLNPEKLHFNQRSLSLFVHLGCYL